jgi:hypothetical protein
MSKDSKKPAAFPYSGEGDDMNYSRGMTLRDYFAAAAMQGMYSSGEYDMYPREYAVKAYAQADAMMEARK